jgi:hypothetical protein
MNRARDSSPLAAFPLFLMILHELPIFCEHHASRLHRLV